MGLAIRWPKPKNLKGKKMTENQEWFVEERVRPGIDFDGVKFVSRLTLFENKEKAQLYRRHLKKQVQSRLVPYVMVEYGMNLQWI